MTVLDWRSHELGKRSGRCRFGPRCLAHDEQGRGGSTLLRDENGKPCHKVCAEAAADRVNERAAAAYTASVHIGQTDEVNERLLDSAERRK